MLAEESALGKEKESLFPPGIKSRLFSHSVLSLVTVLTELKRSVF